MTTTSPELHPVPVKSPFYHIGIDFVGPITPISEDGSRYNYILTISIGLGKLCFLFCLLFFLTIYSQKVSLFGVPIIPASLKITMKRQFICSYMLIVLQAEVASLSLASTVDSRYSGSLKYGHLDIPAI